MARKRKVAQQWEPAGKCALSANSGHSALRFTPEFDATATVNISDFGPVGIFSRENHNLSDEVKLTIDAIFDKI